MNILLSKPKRTDISGESLCNHESGRWVRWDFRFDSCVRCVESLSLGIDLRQKKCRKHRRFTVLESSVQLPTCHLNSPRGSVELFWSFLPCPWQDSLLIHLILSAFILQLWSFNPKKIHLHFVLGLYRRYGTFPEANSGKSQMRANEYSFQQKEMSQNLVRVWRFRRFL